MGAWLAVAAARSRRLPPRFCCCRHVLRATAQRSRLAAPARLVAAGALVWPPPLAARVVVCKVEGQRVGRKRSGEEQQQKRTGEGVQARLLSRWHRNSLHAAKVDKR